MSNLFVVILIFISSFIFRSVVKHPRDMAQSLNLFVIYIALPALVFSQIPKLDFSANIAAPVLMPWILLTLSAGIVLALSRIFSWSREMTGVMLLLVPLGNTSFLGIPMIDTFLGKDAISYAVLYDQLGTFLGLSTYGTIIAALYGKSEHKPTFLAVAKKVYTFPPFLALLVALCLTKFQLPVFIDNAFAKIATALVPLTIFSVGLQVKREISKGDLKLLFTGLGLKLVLTPLIALAICEILGWQGLPARVAIMEAGMPSMVTAGIVASHAGLSPLMCSALVGYGIIVSFATLPLLSLLI